MMFLNCNYPNEFTIPKGKPKEIASKTTSFEIKQGATKLIVLNNGDVYFVEDGYYWGIKLQNFIRKTMFGVNIFETIGAINLAFNDWGYSRGHLYAQLKTQEESLLQKYLLTIR